MNRLRGMVRRVPGVEPTARWGRRQAARVRRRRARTAKLNEGTGIVTPPFDVRPGTDRIQLAERVSDRKWFHTFEFRHDSGTVFVAHGDDPSHEKTQYLGLPDHFNGLSVLDIGAADGHYSFEAARRGASDVLAVDHDLWTQHRDTARANFEFVREVLGLPVRDRVITADDISPEALGGQFDVVLLFGVLHHAPDPIGYLTRVRNVTRRYALIETVVDMLDIARPALGYYPDASLNPDASTYFGPNMPALVGMLEDAGFSRVDDLGLWRLHEVELAAGVSLPTGPPKSGRAVVRAWV